MASGAWSTLRNPNWTLAGDSMVGVTRARRSGASLQAPPLVPGRMGGARALPCFRMLRSIPVYNPHFKWLLGQPAAGPSWVSCLSACEPKPRAGAGSLASPRPRLRAPCSCDQDAASVAVPALLTSQDGRRLQGHRRTRPACQSCVQAFGSCRLISQVEEAELFLMPAYELLKVKKGILL